MDWHAAIGAWRLWSLAGDASAQTLKTRTHYLRALAAQNRGRSPFDLTTDDLVVFLAQSGWQAETRKSARGVFLPPCCPFYKTAMRRPFSASAWPITFPAAMPITTMC